MVTFELPAPAPGPPLFALSVRKCGSSLFNSMTLALGEANGYGYIDVIGTLFEQNVQWQDWQRDPFMRELLRPGIIFGGFRDMPLNLAEEELFIASPKIFMVRDPRDAIVSDYFSTAHSHPVPEPFEGFDDTHAWTLKRRADAVATPIDDWVLEHSRYLNRTMLQYAPVTELPTTLVLKYEDYIFNKERLLHAIAGHFGWHVDDAVVAEILTWADVRPDQDDPTNFIRHVTPGDHRNKLRRRTISQLNRRFRDSMRLFGYR
jgi:hypothetical protein